MRAEFGTIGRVTPFGPGADDEPQEGPTGDVPGADPDAAPPAGGRDFSFQELWDGLGPDEDYRRVSRGRPWSRAAVIGSVLLAAGLLSCLVMLFGLTPRMPWPQVAAATAITGLGILLWQALHLGSQRPDEGEV